MLSDYLPRPRKEIRSNPKPLLPWLVRRVECIRGTLPIQMQCAPAFNYALASHTTTIIDDDSIAPPAQHKKAVFVSDDLTLDLRYVVENTLMDADAPVPEITLEFLDLSAKGHKGLAVQSLLELQEGQCVTFILRTPPTREPNTTEMSIVPVDPSKTRIRASDDPLLTPELMAAVLHVSVRSLEDADISDTHSRPRIVTGMNGYLNRLITVHGRNLYCGVH